MFLLETMTLWMGSLPLAPDEAYYWEWSRRLDLAFFDKGPVVPLIIRFFCGILGDTTFAVRFGALFFQASFILLLFLFIRRAYTSGNAFLAALLMWSTLMFASQGLFMTNDPPVSFFHLLTICLAALAMRSRKPAYWIPTFVVLGIATVSKYTSLALWPSIVLVLALSVEQRSHLKRWQFWVGTLGMFAVLAPQILWNSWNDWPHFGHNAGHLVGGSQFRFRPKHLPELFFGQWGLMGPLMFPLCCYSLWAAFWQWQKRRDALAGLYVMTALPLAGVCIFVASHRSCYANWPMPIYISAILCFVHLASEGYWRDSWVQKRLPLIFATNILFVVAGHLLLSGYSFHLPRDILPTKRLIGWRESAALLDDLRRDPKLCSRDFGGTLCEPLPIIAGNYPIGSELAFYLPDHPRVFILGKRDVLSNQYDLWGGGETIKGKDALLLLDTPEKANVVSARFQSVSPIESNRRLDVFYDGVLVRSVYLYIGHVYDGSSRVFGDLDDDADDL